MQDTRLQSFGYVERREKNYKGKREEKMRVEENPGREGDQRKVKIVCHRTLERKI